MKQVPPLFDSLESVFTYGCCLIHYYSKTASVYLKLKITLLLCIIDHSNSTDMTTNRMLLKIWPHLTFGWPFVNISLTIHPTHNKLYIFVILITSRVIWYTWKVIWSILKIWPLFDPCTTHTGKGPNRSKFCQNIFWPITTSKPPITHFRQNGTWVLLPLQSSNWKGVDQLLLPYQFYGSNMQRTKLISHKSCSLQIVFITRCLETFTDFDQDV